MLACVGPCAPVCLQARAANQCTPCAAAQPLASMPRLRSLVISCSPLITAAAVREVLLCSAAGGCLEWVELRRCGADAQGVVVVQR